MLNKQQIKALNIICNKFKNILDFIDKKEMSFTDKSSFDYISFNYGRSRNINFKLRHSKIINKNIIYVNFYLKENYPKLHSYLNHYPLTRVFENGTIIPGQEYTEESSREYYRQLKELVFYFNLNNKVQDKKATQQKKNKI